MTLLDGLILGVVEGMTEFIPVSSSGHLILVRDILGLNIPGGLAVDAVLQLAAILAVSVYFRHELWRLLRTVFFLGSAESSEKNLLLAIALGTIPGVIFGWFLESRMETVFRNPLLVASALLFGSALMWVADKYGSGLNREFSRISPSRGLLLGFFQALALVPGVSRSGATISGGMLLGLSRIEAVRFSFLLSFPIILGSGLKKLFELIGSDGFGMDLLPLLVALIFAFLTGLASIHWLISYLSRHGLGVFIWYRVVLALVVISLLA